MHPVDLLGRKSVDQDDGLALPLIQIVDLDRSVVETGHGGGGSARVGRREPLAAAGALAK
jgi:hypothetical protein